MCCIYFGDVHELMNAGKTKAEVDWSAFTYGAFAGFLPWLIMWYEIARVLIQ
jgi:hypothetical protein